MEDKMEEKIKEEENSNKEEALNVIKQVCAQFRGTVQEHNVIQQSIKLLEEK